MLLLTLHPPPRPPALSHLHHPPRGLHPNPQTHPPRNTTPINGLVGDQYFDCVLHGRRWNCVVSWSNQSSPDTGWNDPPINPPPPTAPMLDRELQWFDETSSTSTFTSKKRNTNKVCDVNVEYDKTRNMCQSVGMYVHTGVCGYGYV